MSKQEKRKAALIFAVIALVFMVGAILTGGGSGEEETIQEVMRDAVLHDINKVSLLGMEVNPGLLAGVIVSGIMIVFALICRIFFIPKFTMVPGKFQLVLETAVFELFGVQAVTTNGVSISLPAPLSDINGAIMMGCLSYLVIMSGGIAGNGVRGIGKTLKEYSLPISLSFRLFGALLSGALVTELVYYYSSLSYVLPVLVGVLFTLLHALIQAYVLTMLTSLFYGQVSDNTPKPPKEKRHRKNKKTITSTETAEPAEAAAA